MFTIFMIILFATKEQNTKFFIPTSLFSINLCQIDSILYNQITIQQIFLLINMFYSPQKASQILQLSVYQIMATQFSQFHIRIFIIYIIFTIKQVRQIVFIFEWFWLILVLLEYQYFCLSKLKNLKKQFQIKQFNLFTSTTYSYFGKFIIMKQQDEEPDKHFYRKYKETEYQI
ncbi:hypothetical protein ABPG72_012573 [Tetrahymena utriculariae]